MSVARIANGKNPGVTKKGRSIWFMSWTAIHMTEKPQFGQVKPKFRKVKKTDQFFGTVIWYVCSECPGKPGRHEPQCSTVRNPPRGQCYRIFHPRRGKPAQD